MARYVNLLAGDPAPWFQQRSFANPKYAFDTAAGRYIVLCFLGSAGNARSQTALQAALSRADLFNGDKVAFFGVSVDPTDETGQRVQDRYPGYRFFFDFDKTVSRLYGASPVDTDSFEFSPKWVILDPTLRVMKVMALGADGSEIGPVFDFIAQLPPIEQASGIALQAPIIVLRDVFEPDLCRTLIGLYEKHGGSESGYMKEVDGKTVGVHDHKHKMRRDHTIDDQAVLKVLRERFARRILPEIQKVHQFAVTRMERYIVACYAAEDHAHFGAHRDNTTKGTAHRRFAVSVNLNDDFEGGEVSFPEYGARSFKAPAGGAVVFSCSLLHAVSKVTRGQRYAFLPFLYDDAAARIREENNRFLGDGIVQYDTNEEASQA